MRKLMFAALLAAGARAANETAPEKYSVSASIKVDSIETGVPLLNEHPTITFKSTGPKCTDHDQTL